MRMPVERSPPEKPFVFPTKMKGLFPMDVIRIIWNNRIYYIKADQDSPSDYDMLFAPYSTSPDDFSFGQRMATIMEIKSSLSDQFPQLLKQLMELQRRSCAQLAGELKVTERTIINIRKKLRHNYEKDMVTAIALALHLPPILSSALLSAASIQVGSTPVTWKHRFALDALFMKPFSVIQQILENDGLGKLTIK